MSEEESSESAASNESSSDTDDDTILDIPDKDFFKTLSCLKKKDPRIYDSNVQFFKEPPIVIKPSHGSTSSSKANDQEIGEKKNLEDSNSLTHTNKPAKIKNKFSLKDVDNDTDSEDELSAFKKQKEEEPPTHEEAENEYVKYLKGNQTNISDKEAETDLKPLLEYWNKQELDENEKFLKDYILNKKYLLAETNPKVDDEDLSEDERELEEQAEYEVNYNFRFENDENLKLKRFPRNIEGSIRKKDDTRSKKRAEIAQRKKEEKLKKQQEIKKKQKEKLSEIEERLQKLKELTGNPELGFKDDEILEDFDPEKHDQKMREMFNDDYYNVEDEEHPVFNDDEEGYWDNDDINMDCDADISEKKEKLTRTQKKKLRKKKTYKDVMDIAKPAFDPKVHNDFKKYIDEYYSLDCEDFIDDMPCKFKYREVVPNDYGLSIEEILMADDSELNRWASAKKITRRRPEHVEKNEVKIYRQKARDENLKRKLLPSLYAEPEETNDGNSVNAVQDITTDNDDDENPSLEVNNENVEISNGPGVSPKVTKEGISRRQKKNRKRKREKNNLLTDSTGGTESMNNSEGSLNEKNFQKPLHATNNDTKLSNTDGEAVNPSKKKKRRKKNKKLLGNNNTANQNENTTGEPKQRNKNNKFSKLKDTNKNSSMKFENKFNFKKKKEGVVNLSDSRLQAYGIKPKQFRSKILYSQKSEGGS